MFHLALLAAFADPTCLAAFEAVRSRDAVPAVFVSHVPFVQGDLGDGRSRWFLLDTGANRSALDSGVAAELGLADEGATTVEGTAGVIQATTTVLERLSIAGRSTRLSPTVSDLSGLRGPEGQSVAGIVGNDFLGQGVIAFDFERGRVALADPSSDGERAAACGRGVAIADDNGIPRFDAVIDGAPLHLRLDTGAGIFEHPLLWVNITQSQFDQIRRGEPTGEPVTTLGGTGGGGQIALPVHAAQELTVGSLSWKTPRLIVQPRQGYFAREDAVGFLSNAAFKPYGLLIVDYPRGRLTVPPGE